MGDCEDNVDEFTLNLSWIDSCLGKRELHSSRPNFYHTMSMYSTCDSKNVDRMGRTESVEDTLLSPTKPTKDNRFPKYSNSKFLMQGHNDYYDKNTLIVASKRKGNVHRLCEFFQATKQRIIEAHCLSRHQIFYVEVSADYLLRFLINSRQIMLCP